MKFMQDGRHAGQCSAVRIRGVTRSTCTPDCEPEGQLASKLLELRRVYIVLETLFAPRTYSFSKKVSPVVQHWPNLVSSFIVEYCRAATSHSSKSLYSNQLLAELPAVRTLRHQPASIDFEELSNQNICLFDFRQAFMATVVREILLICRWWLYSSVKVAMSGS